MVPLYGPRFKCEIIEAVFEMEERPKGRGGGGGSVWHFQSSLDVLEECKAVPCCVKYTTVVYREHNPVSLFNLPLSQPHRIRFRNTYSPGHSKCTSHYCNRGICSIQCLDACLLSCIYLYLYVYICMCICMYL